MKVLWSPLAAAKLEELTDTISRDKPGAAVQWATQIFVLVESLSALPQRGRIVPEIGRDEVRELLHGGYRVIYRIESSAVSILTIQHSRQLLDVGLIKE